MRGNLEVNHAEGGVCCSLDGGRAGTLTGGELLHAAAVVAQDFAFLAQMLWVLFALVRDIQAIRLLQRALRTQTQGR